MNRLINYSKNKLSLFQWPRRQKLTPNKKHYRFVYSGVEDKIEKTRDEILLLALQTEKEMINLRHKAIKEGVDEQTLKDLEDMVTSIGDHLSDRLIHVGSSIEYLDKNKSITEDLKEIRQDFRDSLSKPFKESISRLKVDVNPIKDTFLERAREVKEGAKEDLKKFVNIATSSSPDTTRIERVKNFIEDTVKGKSYEEVLKGHSKASVGVFETQEREKSEGESSRNQQTGERNPLDYGSDVQMMKDDIEARTIDVKEKLYAQHDKKGKQDQRSGSQEPHVTRMEGNKEFLSKDSYDLHGGEVFDWAVEKAKSKGESIEEGRYKPYDTMDNVQSTARDVKEGVKDKAKGFVESLRERSRERGKDYKENIQEPLKSTSQTVKEKVKSSIPTMQNVREVTKDTAETIKHKGAEGASAVFDKVEHAIFGEKTEEINKKVSEGAHIVKEKLEEGAKIVSEKIKEGVEKYEEDQRKKELEKDKGPYSKDFREEEFINEPSAEAIEHAANVIKDTTMGGAYAAKEKLEEGYEYVKDKAKQVDTQDLKRGAQKVKEKAQEGYEYVKDKVDKATSSSDTMEDVKGKVNEGYENVKDKAKQVDTQDLKRGAQKVKEKAQEGYEYVKDKVGKAMSSDTMEDVKGKAREGYENVKDKAKQVDTQDLKRGAQKVKEKAQEGYEYAKDKVDKTTSSSDTMEDVKGKVKEGYEKVKDKAKQGTKEATQTAKNKLKEGYENVKDKASKGIDNAKRNMTDEDVKRKGKEDKDKKEKK